MDLEGIMLNEISLTEKDKYHMISLMWNTKYKQEQKKNEKNQAKANTATEYRVVITREKESGEDKMVKKGSIVWCCMETRLVEVGML